MKTKKSIEPEEAPSKGDEHIDSPNPPTSQPEGQPMSDDELDQVTGGLNTNWHFDW